MAYDTKYRPRRYADVLGQEASVRVLRQLIKEGKGYHQSYVFCGQFGSGKTTTGRILARALLCASPVDGEPCDACTSCTTLLEERPHECLIEIDAATRSTKDDMLRITEDIQYSSFSGKRRIYLIDESHRLSKSALDALLKPMEDCIPGAQDKQLVCIFCTTEPDKMQPTIFSRCAPAFTIKAVSPEGIATRLAWVCEREGLSFDFDALVTIAEVVECHIRDALKTLEGVSVLGPVTQASVSSYLGLGSNDQVLDLISAMGTDVGAIVLAATALADGASPTSLYERLAEASLIAYRLHLGVGKIPAHWNARKMEALAGKGSQLLSVCARFSAPPRRPTAQTLILDAVAVHNGIVNGAPVGFVTPHVITQQPVAIAITPTTVPAEKNTGMGNVAVNATKPTAPPTVNVDPRAVGGGAASRRVQMPSVSGETDTLDPGVFRGIVSLYLRRLTSAGQRST